MLVSPVVGNALVLGAVLIVGEIIPPVGAKLIVDESVALVVGEALVEGAALTV